MKYIHYNPRLTGTGIKLKSGINPYTVYTPECFIKNCTSGIPTFPTIEGGAGIYKLSLLETFVTLMKISKY